VGADVGAVGEFLERRLKVGSSEGCALDRRCVYSRVV
jgi:hypothetical protein